jgi:hypothetical protein
MGAVKTIGGVLSLLGGAFVLIAALLAILSVNYGTMTLFIYWFSAYPLMIFLSIALGALAIIGGILSMKGKTVGGILALIVGVLWLLGGILSPTSDIFLMFLQPSLIYALISIAIWFPLFIEPILVLVGGILGLVGSSD